MRRAILLFVVLVVVTLAVTYRVWPRRKRIRGRSRRKIRGLRRRGVIGTTAIRSGAQASGNTGVGIP